MSQITSEKTKKKMRDARLKRKSLLGFINTPESREKMKIKATGRKHTEKTKEKLRKIMKDREQIKCESCGRLIGKNKHTCPDSAWNKGKECPQLAKENSCHWLGGISFEPYTLDWTKTLKRSIRERDKYTCFLCKELQEDYAFDVHHIDYDKKNCNPDNLITLCRNCHMKTNHKRDYWLNYFLKYE